MRINISFVAISPIACVTEGLRSLTFGRKLNTTDVGSTPLPQSSLNFSRYLPQAVNLIGWFVLSARASLSNMSKSYNTDDKLLKLTIKIH